MRAFKAARTKSLTICPFFNLLLAQQVLSLLRKQYPLLCGGYCWVYIVFGVQARLHFQLGATETNSRTDRGEAVATIIIQTHSNTKYSQC